jgi:hypothetical protein
MERSGRHAHYHNMKPAEQAPELAKLSSEELRRSAIEGSEQAVDVIVELDLPPRQVELKWYDRGNTRVRLPSSVAEEGPAERDLVEDRVAATRNFLTQVLGQKPRFLATARAFIVRATGAQLREIAASGLIKTVHPNRQLR